MKKYITLPKASSAEAERRIRDVLDPYVENLHPIHEAGLREILVDVRRYLIAEFDGFGFDYEDLLADHVQEQTK